MRKLLAIGVLAAALASSSTAAMAQGTVYFGISGEPTTMDPMMQTGTTFRTVKLGIHRGLVNYDVDGSISNELAESYEVAPDGLSITFTLRDALFHDGSPVTAADVKASLDRIRDPEGTASFRNELSAITDIEIVDDKTLTLTLAQPNAAMIHYLALPESVIVPASWIEAFEADPNAAPIGAGPFRFVNWTRGREIVVERFDDYYKDGKPHLDEVHYVFYGDENARVNAIRTGDVDIIDYVPAREVDALEADPNIRLERTFGPFMGLQFNTQFEPFSHPEVRQAIAYAVDRAVIINTAFNGIGTPIYGLAIPEGYMGYSDEITEYFTHDVERARELLAEAGYADGFEARLLASSQYSFHQNTAVAIQSELAKIGITVTLDLPDWANRMSKAAVADYDFTVMGSLGEITDPDWLSNYYYGGTQLVRTNNSPYFQDDRIDELLDQARASTDQAERETLYAEFAERALELSPLVYYMWRDQSYAVRETVQGFTNMPAFLSFQSGFSIENVTIE
jgi:glutathione transport system substrate-binding protein